jgi:lysophospholipase L1-like esterase
LFARYVAIGDSQTEGLNDHDGHGGYIGWADRLAMRLVQVEPTARYANLAVRGKVTGQIHDEQLAPALVLQPDLVTVVAGVNDLRRSATDIADVVDLIEDMFRQLGSTGATVASCTFPDITSMIPFGSRMTGRLRALNDGIRTAARRHHVTLVDFELHPTASDRRLWSDDRLHLNTHGHRLLADARRHLRTREEDGCELRAIRCGVTALQEHTHVRILLALMDAPEQLDREARHVRGLATYFRDQGFERNACRLVQRRRRRKRRRR